MACTGQRNAMDKEKHGMQWTKKCTGQGKAWHALDKGINKCTGQGKAWHALDKGIKKCTGQGKAWHALDTEMHWTRKFTSVHWTQKCTGQGNAWHALDKGIKKCNGQGKAWQCTGLGKLLGSERHWHALGKEIH